MDASSVPGGHSKVAIGFFGEIWQGYRQFLVNYLVDFLVSGTIWLGLYLFTALTSIAHIPGEAAYVISVIHSLGTVAAMVIFVTSSIIDTIQVRRQQHAQSGSDD